MINKQLTEWFIFQLTGSKDTIIDWRCIDDKDRTKPGHNFRGSIDQYYETLIDYNNRGYGIFCCVNQMDNHGRNNENVQAIRAQFVDLDNTLSSAANYQRCVEAGACFAVQTSHNKFHLYWKVQPYQGNDFFTLHQKKLIQLYDGDPPIHDPARVMRVPGFYHLKGDPILVTGWELPCVHNVYTFEEIQQHLVHVNLIEHAAQRHELGTKELEAPSLEWLQFAMNTVDPNDLDYGEWMSLTAAYKQAGWNYATEKQLYDWWANWCSKHTTNNAGENLKLWTSLRDTEIGWKSIKRRTSVNAYMSFGLQKPPDEKYTPPPATNDKPVEEPVREFGEILSHYDQQEYFKDCYFIGREGRIYHRGRKYKESQFNGVYGGHQFIITSTGKLSDSAWTAATRSTVGTIPKVDHVRFLPELPSYHIIKDALGRKGLNTYIPANVMRVVGDVTPFLNHMKKMFPVESDRKIIYDFMAHNVKYPGYKIPWAPVIQSAQGVGKTLFIYILEYALGSMYTYKPNAQEMAKSGMKFNSWMRDKLMIMVNEIRVDERRELIEILKPMITDVTVEVEAKGIDQDIEDNPANWLFFSNFRDAVPIDRDDRRYAIFYSVLQFAHDIEAAGMDKEYFDNLFRWLDEGGNAAIAQWLYDYPIERGDIPKRAPVTSSYEEAILENRSLMEVAIDECVENQLSGFRGGFISVQQVVKQCSASGMRKPNKTTVRNVLGKMGYKLIGKTPRAYMQEDMHAASEVFGNQSGLILAEYGRQQGYE